MLKTATPKQKCWETYNLEIEVKAEVDISDFVDKELTSNPFISNLEDSENYVIVGPVPLAGSGSTLRAQKCSAKGRQNSSEVCKEVSGRRNSAKVMTNPLLNPLEKLRCSLCKYSTTYKSLLQTHLLKTHPPEASYSGDGFAEEPENEQYPPPAVPAAASGERIFFCPMCCYQSASKKKLQKHKTSKHNVTGKKFRCYDCRLSFPNKRDLKRHLRTHLSSKEFQCHECDYESNSKSDMRYHIHNHLGIYRFNCSLCDFATNRRSIFTSHSARHANPKGQIRTHWRKEEEWLLFWAHGYAMKRYPDNRWDYTFLCEKIFTHFCQEVDIYPLKKMKDKINSLYNENPFTKTEIDFMLEQVELLIREGKDPLTYPILLPKSTEEEKVEEVVVMEKEVVEEETS